MRREILDVISDWLRSGSGAQDILDETPLYNAVEAFLTSATEFTHQDPSQKENASVSQAYANLRETLANLTSQFLAQTMRPSLRPYLTQDGLITTTDSQNFGSEPPDLDTIQPETLVNNLDAMAAAAFRNVAEEVNL